MAYDNTGCDYHKRGESHDGKEPEVSHETVGGDINYALAEVSTVPYVSCP